MSGARWLADIALAWRNLTRQWRRSSASLGAVAFSVAALLAATGFNAALFEEFREATIRSDTGHLQITRPGFQQRGRSDPAAFLLPPEPPLALAALGQDGVLAPRLLVNGLASFGERTLPFIAEGVDPAVDLRDDQALELVAGERLQPGSDEQLLLGRGLAARLGAAVGATVVLLTNTPDGQLSAVEAPVVGTFRAFSEELDEAALVMPIGLARRLLAVDGAHSWRVFLEDTAATEQALGAVRGALAGRDLEVTPWPVLAEFYRRAAALFGQQLAALKAIVIAILLLGIGNTMLMSVLERTREIGTVMALGRRRGQVLTGFLIEGALIGLLGALVGVVLAFAGAGVLALAAIEMPPPPTFARAWTASLQLEAGDVLQTVVLACLTTTLAALYPAWRASRMAIVDSLRSAR
jgi:putative ABC transport system permease protein